MLGLWPHPIPSLSCIWPHRCRHKGLAVCTCASATMVALRRQQGQGHPHPRCVPIATPRTSSPCAAGAKALRTAMSSANARTGLSIGRSVRLSLAAAAAATRIPGVHQRQPPRVQAIVRHHQPALPRPPSAVVQSKGPGILRAPALQRPHPRGCRRSWRNCKVPVRTRRGPPWPRSGAC